MDNIIHRVEALALMAAADVMPPPIMIVRFCEGNHHTGTGPWVAAICEFGSSMPLLDSEGEQSLAAAGVTPMEAMRNLDAKLGTLP